jgi:hypothetical protein
MAPLAACIDDDRFTATRTAPAQGRLVERAEYFLPGLSATMVVSSYERIDSVVVADAVIDDEVLSPQEALRRESHAYYTRFGKQSPDLAELIAQLRDDELVTIHVLAGAQADEPELPSQFEENPSSATLEDYTAWRAGAQERARDSLRAAKEEILRVLGTVKASTTDHEELPIVTATVPVALLRRRALDEIASVVRLDAVNSDDAQGPEALLGYAGHASMKEESFVGGLCGSGAPCLGGGIDVGLWEAYNSALPGVHAGIAIHHSRLAPLGSIAYQLAPASCLIDDDCTAYPGDHGEAWCYAPSSPTPGKCVHEHISSVAASLGMFGDFTYPAGEVHPNSVTFSDRSGTHDVQAWVANDGSNAVSGLNWLLANPVPYINRSATTHQTADFATNWAVRNALIGYFQASGNIDVSTLVECDGVWNGVCVGAYALGGRYDVVSKHYRPGFSVYLNSPGGPERPHILGPGMGLYMPRLLGDGLTAQSDMHNFELPNPPNIYVIEGTSFATPAVMSVAIQYHQYEGFLSRLAYPYVNKAVLLAASVDSNHTNGVGDGAIGKGNTWNQPLQGGQPVDAEDGAGHPHMGKAKALLDGDQHRRRVLTDASFTSCGANCREYVVATTAARLPNQVLRVALAWNACQQSAATAPFVNNDLDLYVRDMETGPGGNTLAVIQSTAGLSSEVEIVSRACLAQTSCTAEIRVRIKNGAALNSCFGNSSESIGVAWVLS